MTEGNQPSSFDAINEALKNSFAAIRRDMDFLRSAQQQQQEVFQQQIEALRTQLTTNMHRTQEDVQGDLNECNERLDRLTSKTSADIEFLNEAVSAIPKHKDNHDTDVLKAFIEHQINQLQAQINVIKTNSSGSIAAEQNHEEIVELQTLLQNAFKRCDALEETLKHTHKEHKSLQKELKSVHIHANKETENMQTRISSVLSALNAIAEQVQHIDAATQNIGAHSQESESLAKELELLKKSITERLEKVASDAEMQLSKHNLIENKNFDVITNELKKVKKELDTLKTLSKEVGIIKATYAPLEHLQAAEEKIHVLHSERAHKKDVDAVQHTLTTVEQAMESRLRTLSEQLQEEFQKELLAVHKEVVPQKKIVSMIAEESGETQRSLARLQTFEKEFKQRMVEKFETEIETLRNEIMLRSEVESSLNHITENIKQVERTVESLEKDTTSRSEDLAKSAALERTQLATRLTDALGELKKLKALVDENKEASVLQTHFTEYKKRLGTRIEEQQNNLTTRIEGAQKQIAKLLDTSVTQRELSEFDRRTENTITSLQKNITKLTTHIEELESFKKESKKSFASKTTTLDKDLRTAYDMLETHQKLLNKVTKHTNDLRSDVDKNYESARKLNTLIKKFGQLKEISLSEIPELEERNTIGKKIKSITGIFKKKPRARQSSASSYERESRAVDTTLKKLETEFNAISKTKPRVKVEEKKPKRAPKKAAKQEEAEDEDKEIGLIAKIGLEQGIITEKDL